MSEEAVKNSAGALNEYALKAFTEDWREAQKRADDPKLSAEHREFYRQKAANFMPKW